MSTICGGFNETTLAEKSATGCWFAQGSRVTKMDLPGESTAPAGRARPHERRHIAIRTRNQQEKREPLSMVVGFVRDKIRISVFYTDSTALPATLTGAGVPLSHYPGRRVNRMSQRKPVPENRPPIYNGCTTSLISGTRPIREKMMATPKPRPALTLPGRAASRSFLPV